MRILITGGAGFIGGWLAVRLAQGNELVLVDRDFRSAVFSATGLASRDEVKCVEVDIRDYAAVAPLLEKAQIVIHTAAVLGVREVIANPRLTMEVNYLGTSNVLRAAEMNADLERFVFLSSSEVYGLDGFEPREDGPASFEPVGDPRWSYAISKLAGEQLCFSHHQGSGLPVVIVRPFNVFGPRRLGGHAVLQFIRNALNGEELTVYGDGSQIRAWCYVGDFVDGLLQCLTENSAVGETFNIGNPNNAISAYDLAVTIRELCGSDSRIVRKPPDFTDIPTRVPNINKARALLGFEPQIDLKEGLRTTIRWCKSFLENS